MRKVVMRSPLRRVAVPCLSGRGGVRERLASRCGRSRPCVLLTGLLSGLLSGLLGALLALACDTGRAAQLPPPAAEEKPAAAAEPKAADGAEAKPAAEEKPAAEPAAEPQPVGKLGIRKGTGRPAEAAPTPRRAVQRRAVPQQAAPPVAVGPADLALQDKAVEEHAKALQPQIETTLRGALPAELYFIHLVCATDRQQRRQLAQAAETLLPEVAAEAALQTARGQRGGNPAGRMLHAGRMLPDADQADPPQPLEMFRQRLVSLVTEQLGPQLGERLQQELQQRLASQRRATIANVITQLDTFLALSPQQQEDLVQPLLSGWQESWRSLPQYVQPQYMPEMHLPTAALRQLSDTQRQRWQSLPKVRISHHRQPETPNTERWQKALEQLDRDEAADPGQPPPAQEPSE